jgi:hypothetical protein
MARFSCSLAGQSAVGLGREGSDLGVRFGRGGVRDGGVRVGVGNGGLPGYGERPTFVGLRGGVVPCSVLVSGQSSFLGFRPNVFGADSVARRALPPACFRLSLTAPACLASRLRARPGLPPEGTTLGARQRLRRRAMWTGLPVVRGATVWRPPRQHEKALLGAGLPPGFVRLGQGFPTFGSRMGHDPAPRGGASWRIAAR